MFLAVLSVACGMAAVIYTVPAVRSRLLGSIDLAAALVTQKKGSFFPKGLGDGAKFDHAAHKLLEPLGDNNCKDVEVGEWIVSGKSATAHVSFRSPVADYLPEGGDIKRVHCQVVVPSEGLQPALNSGMPFVIHLAATGDEGFSLRREYLAKPLLDKGVASVIMQIPFYGKRRFPGQKGYGLLYLDQLAEQAVGCAVEANAIAHWLKKELKCKGPIGFCGISFGGSMAALASAIASLDHAAIAMVPSHGPQPPFVEGEMARSVRWDAFAADPTEARSIVSKYLAELDVALALETHVQDKVKRSYVQLSGEHDHYIPTHSARMLAKSMSNAPNTQCAVHWLEGGHVAAIFMHRKRYIEAIHQAFATLQAQ